ncbi:MAG TPA: hypothetical protein VGL47_19600 [Amycolatopsis sp.]|uniref:hypothetical protein n=1 Tax=Amycolatopsis sp. TaxID=37632 RepID=UPI002F426A84
MPEGRGSRIDSGTLRAGGFATRHPERLRAAADLLDQAAAAGDKAAGRFAEARVDSTPFGISPQARELAARWASALAARETDARVLGDATSDLAGRLRMSAGTPRSTGFRGRLAVAP